MADNDNSALDNKHVVALAELTNVTPDQIREIVKLVGLNKSSILFHARLLAKRNRS